MFSLVHQRFLYGTFPSQLGHSGFTWQMESPGRRRHKAGRLVMMRAGFRTLVPSRAAKTTRGAPRALASSSQTRAAAARWRAIFLSTALLSFALLSNLDKHAPNDRGGLWGQSWVIIPQTPLARLIKVGHLCLIPHLEQVAPAPAGSSPSLPLPNNDGCKRLTQTPFSPSIM